MEDSPDTPEALPLPRPPEAVLEAARAIGRAMARRMLEEQAAALLKLPDVR